MMLPERLRVLIVDDSSDDALLIVNAITDGDVEVIYQRVDDAASLRAALKDPWDVAISDYSMPNLTAAEALRIVTEAQASLPFIVVSGVIGEDAAVQMMRAGALDYVMKDRLSRLLPAIRREMGDVKSRKALETAAAARNDLEMQLRERDERYRQIVDNAQEGIWTIDVEGRTTFVNRSMSEMLGYEPDEMLGRHLHDFLYEADKDRADTLAVRRRLGFSDCDDFVLRARSGESVRIRFTANPLHDSGGTYIGALAMVTDVTARWDAEKTVIRQKKELDEAQRIAHLGSWRRDLPGDAIEWSDGLFQIYGIDPATSPTMDLLFNLIFPDDRKRFVETITPSIERGLPVDMHYRIVRPDGAVRSVHTIGEVTLDEAGVPTHIRGVTQDVTERLQAAAEHQTLNRDVQLLLESTTQGIFGVDCDGYCTFINRAASEALGFPPGELVGRSMHDVTHQGADCNHAPAECPIESAARTGTAVEVQADRLCRRDGSSLPVEYSAAPIIDGGIVKGAVVVFTDVSERKLLQAQLEQSDRVSSLGRLAATMAHEFNNVLMGIQPFAEMLSRQNSGDSAQIATHNILQAVQRGRSITHGILRFARPAELVKETIDVTTWLRSMDATLTAVVGDRIRLGLRIDGEDLFIRGDRHQLEQVLTNLAANARDAMDDRGELAIVVERCLSGYVFPFGAIRTIDQYLHISMKDTGCGMDAKTLKAIFDPFFTTKRTGTGLGLAVVHQVMQLHGGSIIAESTPGKGTVFHLFLPLSEESFQQGESIPFQAMRTAVGSILMVEDDEAISDGVAELLRNEGIVVEVAASGAAALVSLARHVPEAVILDVGLPDIDGRLLYERIAALYPDLAVVFASGSSDEEIFRPYLKPGQIASLTKPYELAALLHVLDTVRSGGGPMSPDDLGGRP